MTLLDQIIETLADELPIPKHYILYVLNKHKGAIEKWLKKNKSLIQNYLKTL